MVPPRLAQDVSQLKYRLVADRLREEVAAGIFAPGQAVPSGAALARVTGYSAITCRRAVSTLINEGVLIPGASSNARPRVPSAASTPGDQASADAARALSASLAARRRTAGLTQPELAARIGVSVTTVGHAETGRLWQSRRFWEHADKVMDAGGELLAMHDAYQAAAAPLPRVAEASRADVDQPGALPAVAIAASELVRCVAITWADGTVTTVYPPSAKG